MIRRAIGLCVLLACASGGEGGEVGPPDLGDDETSSAGTTGGNAGTEADADGETEPTTAPSDGSGSSGDADTGAGPGTSTLSPPGTSSGDGCVEFNAMITVDFVEHCTGDGTTTVTDDVPAGTYVATALDSGATRHPPPWDPPTSGWYYRVQCTGVDFGNMQTPEGIHYADAAEAFDNIITDTTTFDWDGGDIVCAVDDGICDNNDGEVSLTIERQCD